MSGLHYFCWDIGPVISIYSIGVDGCCYQSICWSHSFLSNRIK